MHIVILGNGVAGVTAARSIRRQSDHSITIISGESDYFFSRTALMYVFMGNMRMADLYPYPNSFWSQNRIQCLRGWVSHLDTAKKIIHLDNGQPVVYDRLILATGSSPSLPAHIPGIHLKGVQGLFHLEDLEKMEQASRNLHHAAVVGGGLIGIEMAEMLHARNIPVSFLVREKSYMDYALPPEESAMVSRHIREKGIDLHLETTIAAIYGDDSGSVNGISTHSGLSIPCQWVGMAIGVHPNINLALDTPLQTQRGFVVDEYLQTNIPDIFAVGDCAELRNPPPGRKAIESTWYAARMMGEAVANSVLGIRQPYNPGITFNSAKFFDLEYQTYGDVLPYPAKGTSQIFYSTPDGKKSIRIAWKESDGAVLGFLLMGIRYRQAVCEQWIQTCTPIDTVLSQLALANFDPECSLQYEKGVLDAFHHQTGHRIIPRSQRKLDDVLRFLHLKS